MISWRKSSYSTAASNCVEVALTSPVGVRDSKNTGPTLTFPTTAWTRFLAVID